MAWIPFAAAWAWLRRTAAAWQIAIWYTPLGQSPVKPLMPLLRLGSKLYAGGLARHQRQLRANTARLPAYVISVGNLSVGGTGKTPFTLWLASYLRSKELHTAILSRGYGRDSHVTARVPQQADTASLARQFGDEPVLMARKTADVPVWVGRSRTLSGWEAIRASAPRILLLDDGFQHLSLHRDLDLVLLDAQSPFGNGCLLPLGPLREPVEHLKRSDALILTHAQEPVKVQNTCSLLAERFPDKPVFVCKHVVVGFKEGMNGPVHPIEALQKETAVAFAGIAHPGGFFRSLRELGLSLCEAISFPDHYHYSSTEIARLLEIKKRCGARFLITTEKDMVRLPVNIYRLVLTALLELDFGAQARDLQHYLDERLPSPL